MKDLKAAETANETTLGQARQIMGIIMNSPNVTNVDPEGSADHALAMLEDALAGFDPNQTDPSSVMSTSIGAAKNRLNFVLFGALKLMEPSLANKYTDDLLSSLWNREVMEEADPSLQGFVSGKNFWKFSAIFTE